MRPCIDGGKALIRNHGDDHPRQQLPPTQGKRHPAADMERVGFADHVTRGGRRFLKGCWLVSVMDEMAPQ